MVWQVQYIIKQHVQQSKPCITQMNWYQLQCQGQIKCHRYWREKSKVINIHPHSSTKMYWQMYETVVVFMGSDETLGAKYSGVQAKKSGTKTKQDQQCYCCSCIRQVNMAAKYHHTADKAINACKKVLPMELMLVSREYKSPTLPTATDTWQNIL